MPSAALGSGFTWGPVPTDPGNSGPMPPEFEELCGAWMPRKRTWCALKPGHKKKYHRSFAGVAHDRAYANNRKPRVYAKRMGSVSGRAREKDHAAQTYAYRQKIVNDIKTLAA